MTDLSKELHEQERRLLVAEAELRAAIIVSGDKIGQENGYPNLTGMDAICRYLADKHHWFPEQIRALSTDDLQLLLE